LIDNAYGSRQTPSDLKRGDTMKNVLSLIATLNLIAAFSAVLFYFNTSQAGIDMAETFIRVIVPAVTFDVLLVSIVALIHKAQSC
jgi:hypothetical protein